MTRKNREDDKEKYQAYLCGREWAEKREAVRKRAGDTCERCKILPMDACHHLTYERKYHERLEDLQAICNSCHEFTHGKDDFDPAAHPKWMRYLSHCKEKGRTPVTIDIAYFGLWSEVIDNPDDEEMMARMFVVKQVTDAIHQFNCLAQEEVSDVYRRILAFICAEFPFAMEDWIAFGMPEIDYEKYPQSLERFGLKAPQRLMDRTK